MFRQILASTDGSPRSGRAIKAAAELARIHGATLTIFHAIPTYRTPYYAEGMGFAWPSEAQYVKAATRDATGILSKAAALAARQGHEARTMQAQGDDIARAIAAAATKVRADLIVMASHGRKGLGKLLLGSETQKVLACTRTAVLVVR